MWFIFLGGGLLYNFVLILFFIKVILKFINKIVLNMLIILKKEKEVLGKNEIIFFFEVWRKYILKYVLVYLCLLKIILYN